jgi:hypothetical protein
MIVQLKDGPLVIGYGRNLDEAIHQACDINRRLGSEPHDEPTMKRMIDVGAIKIREIPDDQRQ